MHVRRIACALAGLSMIAIALLPLVRTLAAEYLLSVHVVRQLALTLGAPLFFLCALPKRESLSVRIPWWLCWASGMAGIAIWYVPRVFAAWGQNDATLLVSFALGVLFWWPLFTPWEALRLSPAPAGIAYLFCATIFASLLGIVLTFIRPEAYAHYLNPKDSLGILVALETRFNLARENDQETAGLTMWIGSCTFFLSAVMWMFYRLYTSKEKTVDKLR